MAHYQASSFYAKLIKQKYDRSPYQYPQQGKQEYEDHEFVRSLAYENGEMNFVTSTSKRRSKYKGVAPVINGNNINSVGKTDSSGRLTGDSK